MAAALVSAHSLIPLNLKREAIKEDHYITRVLCHTSDSEVPTDQIWPTAISRVQSEMSNGKTRREFIFQCDHTGRKQENQCPKPYLRD
jgi:hypothetical protein